MRKYVERKIETVSGKPVVTQRYIESRVCDLCGVDSKKRERSCGKYAWDNGENPDIKTAVHFAETKSSPDCLSINTIEFDICPKCFKEKLIPWLEGQGAKADVVKNIWRRNISQP